MGSIIAAMKSRTEAPFGTRIRHQRGNTMTAATTQEWTFHLPPDIIEMLRKAATERQETPDQIVAEALRLSLQPVRQEALRRLNTQIQKQKSQSKPEIRAHLESHLNVAEQKRLSQLLDRN